MSVERIVTQKINVTENVTLLMGLIVRRQRTKEKSRKEFAGDRKV